MMEHLSDCGLHNLPAYPNGPCTCGKEAIELLARNSYENICIKSGEKLCIPFYCLDKETQDKARKVACIAIGYLILDIIQKPSSHD